MYVSLEIKIIMCMIIFATYVEITKFINSI